MELHHLRMFCAIAKTGSLASASRQLKLTPSALSHGLKALEQKVGCRLLDRIGKRVFLNQAGEQLFMQVQRPIQALDQAEEGIRRLGKWGQKRLRIGASAAACQYILPSVIENFQKKQQNVLLQVTSGDMPEMVELLRSNKVDMALGASPQGNHHLTIHPLFRDELMLVLSPSHPWADGRSIPYHEMIAQPFILYQRQSVTMTMIQEYFRAEHITPQIMMEVGNIEAIKELIKLNLGVGVLAPWTFSREWKEGSLIARTWGSQPLTRKWVMAYLESRKLSLVEEEFFRICKAKTGMLLATRKDLKK